MNTLARMRDRAIVATRVLTIAVVIVMLTAGCGTKRKAMIGIATGAVMMVGGITIAETAPDGGRDGQIFGLVVFGSGGGVIGVSVLSLVVHLLNGPVSRVLPAETPARSRNPEGRRCEPVAPDSSLWTCARGVPLYR